MRLCIYLKASAAILVVGSLCVLCGHANASGQLLSSYVKLQNGPGSNAGEFRVDDGKKMSLGTGLFNTFCVQRQEFINYNTSYRVALGNVPVANPNSVNITVGDGKKASALYREFLRGKPTSAAAPAGNILGVNYNFNKVGNVTNTDADLLQKAIWYYMGQNTAGTTLYATLIAAKTNNAFINAVETQNSAIQADNGYYGGVQVMNLFKGSWNMAGTVWTDNANDLNAQDQLYYNPNRIGFSNNPVPEPSTLVLFGIAFLGAAWSRRGRSASMLA